VSLPQLLRAWVTTTHAPDSQVKPVREHSEGKNADNLSITDSYAKRQLAGGVRAINVRKIQKHTKLLWKGSSRVARASDC
jgi:hypothetical protein